MTAPPLFDRELRRLRRTRGWRSAGSPFVHDHAFAEIVERLGDVRRSFGNALLVGCGGADWRERLGAVVPDVAVMDPSPVIAAANAGVAGDEDRLPFADASFDLAVAIGTLDSVDDLPGALILLRRVLRPDGLMLAALSGAGSLPRLRQAMLAADAVRGGASARLHPAIDVRGGGDLLARAGFTLPVADAESLDVSYAGLAPLIADLRKQGATNMLARRSRTPLDRQAHAAAAAEFATGATDGRVMERVEILYLSGWSPGGEQPLPKKRGDDARPFTKMPPPRS